MVGLKLYGNNKEEVETFTNKEDIANGVSYKCLLSMMNEKL